MTNSRSNRYQSYMICTTPRSGSTLLCRMLAATGIAGAPDSYFHVASLDRWMQDFEISATDHPSRRDAIAAVFAAAQRLGRANSAVFGLRIQRGSFAYLMSQIKELRGDDPSEKTLIEGIFGRTAFVHLTRQNKLDQAISRLIAEQTGLWHLAADGIELERQAPPEPPIYDASAIARHLSDLTKLDQDWLDWFQAQGIRPLQIAYEDLARDPRAALNVVLDHLGLDASQMQKIEIPTARLSSRINQDWAIRFRSESL